jgi:hypothetical protein
MSYHVCAEDSEKQNLQFNNNKEMTLVRVCQRLDRGPQQRRNVNLRKSYEAKAATTHQTKVNECVCCGCQAVITAASWYP